MKINENSQINRYINLSMIIFTLIIYKHIGYANKNSSGS